VKVAASTMASRGGRPRDQDELGLEGVGFLLGLAHRARRRRWDATLADLGLTVPQAAILRLVSAEPGCGVRHLARRLGTDPMNAQRIMESLVTNGLCTAGHDPDDARRRPFFPTERGRRLAKLVTTRSQEVEQALAELLGEDTYQALVDALRTLVEGDAGARFVAAGPGMSPSRRRSQGRV